MYRVLTLSGKVTATNMDRELDIVIPEINAWLK